LGGVPPHQNNPLLPTGWNTQLPTVLFGILFEKAGGGRVCLDFTRLAMAAFDPGRIATLRQIAPGGRAH